MQSALLSFSTSYYVGHGAVGVILLLIVSHKDMIRLLGVLIFGLAMSARRTEIKIIADEGDLAV